ncbi:MAG: O-antigen ligase family protein [Kiritimatiellaeota bacterium]|nr:O-antigen ligase family protein [Kiritimatiellota bacterium]
MSRTSETITDNLINRLPGDPDSKRRALSLGLRKASHAMMFAVLGLMAFFTELEIFVKFTPVDIALGLAAGLWALSWALGRARSPSAPPLGSNDRLGNRGAAGKGLPALPFKDLRRYWPMGLYVLWTLVSACFAQQRGLALVKVFQTLEYYVVALVLLHDLFSGTQEEKSSAISHQPSALPLQRGAWIVLAVFAVFVTAAATQYWGGADTFGVRGVFKHRNVFAGLVALLAPACFGVMCESRNWPLKIALGILTALALVVTLSGAAYVAALLAIAGIAAVRGARCLIITCAAITLWQGVALDWMEEKGWLRNNVAEHLESVALYEDDGQPAPRYPEWQAAAWVATDHPLAGVGPGHYQRTIGPYFGVIPRSARDKNESDVEIQNQYLVLAATLGWPGLLAFLAMLATGVAAATRAAARLGRGDWRRGLASGMAGGLLAFAAVLVWHPLLIRGIGLVFVAMLAACHAFDARKDPA